MRLSAVDVTAARPSVARCNLCGGSDFSDMNGRQNIRCTNCGSVERTRILMAVMSEEISVRPGMAILHIAPEKGISDYFLSLPGVYYRPVDLIPSLYKHVQVEKMDLVSDAEKLPSNTFDVVFHSHVIEHIPSNYSAVLLHLHRSLKADGLHIFSIPIYGGGFEECLENIGPEERMRRFRQDDHVRRFGRGDIDQTIGKLFSIQSKYDLLARYPHIDLENMNVPTSAAKGYSSNSVFCLRKKDCYFFQ